MDKYFYAEKKGSTGDVRGDFNVRLGDDQPDGIFAEWHWNGAKLVLKNDRYGFYPIYYAENKSGFAVSSSIRKLLELGFSAELDDAAFAVFLRFSAYLAQDTPFKEIRAVPPDAVLTWEQGAVKIVAEEFSHPPPLRISRREAVATYAALFQKAVEKTLPADDFVVPLSGGRDSRHIVLALDKIGRKPAACVTVRHPPPRSDEDARVAQEICRAAGIEHLTFEQTGTKFDSEVRKNVETSYCAFEHGWFVALAEQIRGRWETVYDGIAGDVLSAGLFLDAAKLNLFERGKFAELAEHILFPEAYLPVLLTKKSYRSFSRELAVTRFAEELSRHAAAPNPVGSFYFWNRTRRCIALSPFGLFGDSMRIITPYLDRETFDFLVSLPAEMFSDQQFHTETIAFAYPKYAAVGYEKKEAGGAAAHPDFQRYSREILKFGLTGRSKELTNRGFLISRCLRGMIDKSYSRNVVDFGMMAILLLQLERL